MSFYRTLIAAFGAMSLATVVFAADQNLQNPADPNQAQMEGTALQLADAQPASNNADAAQPASEAAKVNVNTATAKELMQVKGLSASKAKAIVSFRKKHGEFKSLDDLKQVRGFKKLNEQTLRDLQDQLTVG